MRDGVDLPEADGGAEGGVLHEEPVRGRGTALGGPGSEGLGLRQRYSVTMVRNGKRQKLADGLIAVPSNVGPSTMPNYAALAAQGVNTLANGSSICTCLVACMARVKKRA